MHELHELNDILKTWFEWTKAHSGQVTKQDLHEMEKRIMAKIDDLVAAATVLSTASDSLSLKVDDLVTKVDALLATIQSGDLSPAGEAALAALKTSRDTAAAAGDKVDAEVTKLDGQLPVPAPAGQPPV